MYLVHVESYECKFSMAILANEGTARIIHIGLPVNIGLLRPLTQLHTFTSFNILSGQSTSGHVKKYAAPLAMVTSIEGDQKYKMNSESCPNLSKSV